MVGGAPGPPERCAGGTREGVPSPGHSWARSDQTVSPGTTEETSARTFLFTHKCKLASKKRLQEWCTYFWGNSCIIQGVCLCELGAEHPVRIGQSAKSIAQGHRAWSMGQRVDCRLQISDCGIFGCLLHADRCLLIRPAKLAKPAKRATPAKLAKLAKQVSLLAG